MGFLSKKSMLVSLLALSLAACTSVSNKATDPPINLSCDGDYKQEHQIHNTQQTITLQTSGCNLTDFNFTDNVGEAHFKNKKHSGNQINFDYDGLQLGAGAHFGYTTDYIPPGKSTDGGGGGIIKN